MVSFLKLRRQCGVSHEVRQGAQGASLMAPGKSGLHVRGGKQDSVFKVYVLFAKVGEGMEKLGGVNRPIAM